MTRMRRTRTLRRMLAGFAGFALFVGVVLAPSPQDTEASWSDPEVGMAQFTAATSLAAPTGTGCTAASLLGAVQRITIQWQMPEGSADNFDYDFEYGMRNGGAVDDLLDALLGSTSTTGTPGQFTTVLSNTDLGSLLGGTASFAVRMTGPGEWASPWLVADVTFPVLLGQRQCDALTIVNE